MTRVRGAGMLLAGVALSCGAGAPPAPRTTGAAPPRASAATSDVAWLEERAMLHRARELATGVSGTGTLWQRPYGRPEPRAASAKASVWFTAYPASTIGRPGASVLRTLGDPELWKTFQALGVQGVHTGPMKRSGGVRGREYTPTVDGNFDRIGMEIDPAFGTEAEYAGLVTSARAHGAIVIGDVIPGHSGKGPDFRLAERGYQDYPGLYHMVEIPERDWGLLPPVAPGRDAVNLLPAAVDTLRARGYLVGQLPRTIFQEKGVKETDWSATDVVVGADGKKRRWVYLHYFKEGQPTFNWLDPSFAAERLVAGDALHSLRTLGEDMLRLDANGFLGIEPGPPGARAWSEGHPLSVTANQLLGGLVRKLGGFTFQELNLTFEDLAEMARGGPDLSYDFVTRPAVQHALVTGDAGFLRVVVAEQKRVGIDPASLIHALQNHDELTLELVHFWTKHAGDTFRFRGKDVKGSALRDLVRDEMHAGLLAPRAPYNLRASNGVSCTSVTLAAARLGVKLGPEGWAGLAPADREGIQKAHLLLAMFDAMQPGVFALSGWDLVGATTLAPDTVKDRMADGDTRWIERGAYDLLGVAKDAKVSPSGLPRAHALYGALPEQLAQPSSFASRLRKLLEVRKETRLFEAAQIDVPAPKSEGLYVMVHRLPEGRGLEVTALNFGAARVREEIAIKEAPRGARATDLLDASRAAPLSNGRLALDLAPLEGAVLLVK